MITLIVRHPSLTKEAFEKHHREIHAPLFAANIPGALAKCPQEVPAAQASDPRQFKRHRCLLMPV
jgi:hypothetical protein